MPLKVSNFMSAKVLSAHPQDGIRQTFFRMRENEVRHMPLSMTTENSSGSLVIAICGDQNGSTKRLIFRIFIIWMTICKSVT